MSAYTGLPQAKINGVNENLATEKFVNEILGLRSNKSPALVKGTTLPDYTYENGDDGVGATITLDADGVFDEIDGVTLANGARVLLTLPDAKHSGIYQVVSIGAVDEPSSFVRTTDYDTPEKIADGSTVFIQQGTSAGLKYVMITDGEITIGTTAIEFQEYKGSKTGEIVTFEAADFDGLTVTITAGEHGLQPFNRIVATVQEKVGDVYKNIGNPAEVNTETGSVSMTMGVGGIAFDGRFSIQVIS